MCTAVTLNRGGLYFGRNMDLECSFGEKVVLTPRRYQFITKRAGTLSEHYSLIGMANVTAGYPLYAEAANEKGLCMAGLNFPENAWYPARAGEGRLALAPYELIPYLLGRCATLIEARWLLEQLELVDLPFHPRLPVAPLHWMVADSSGCLVVEQTRAGVQIYDNPYGVLTNNPPFPFHRENLRQYLHLTAAPPENGLCPSLSLSPFGQGAGAMGLPGDFSSASRFVRALFCRMNSPERLDPDAAVAQVFHILDAVAMVEGAVITPEGRPDRTTYSCCIDTAAGAYYYKTYGNSRLTRVTLSDQRSQGSQLQIFPLRQEPDCREEEGPV